ncbi:conserved Plasmodium protein, unknown function [Plasmodium ovale]|uniref:Uncharacterized protein n=1 Tax=Plasmodium ovale TaxID=36330 RepID=A0A1D3TIV1_PLAOA|nr:conserved Plasmodium protein, unknown function [Plasmodium ovale]
MGTLDHRWNDRVSSFHLKINKLQNDINNFKKDSSNICSPRNKMFISKLNNNAKRRELIRINNLEMKNHLRKINNTTFYVKDDKNSKIGNTVFPTTKNTSNKIIKTNDIKMVDCKNSLKLNLRNKRKNEKVIKMNEKRWLIATKHMKIEKSNDIEKEKKKKKRNGILYLEGEEGNLHMYPIYADSEVGFENISHMEDENLSKVKKENQDDDDIKTTKHLAQWSSDLVHKYLEEAIEKINLIFHSSNVKCRHEEMFKRMKS